MIVSDRPTVSAGVLTQNVIHAACVDYTRQVLASGGLRAVVVNSGNANCCTGEQGVIDTQKTAALAAQHLKLEAGQIGVASTGVIGHTLDMAKVETGVIEASQKLKADPRPFMDAILTTDLVEKWAASEVGNDTVYSPAHPHPTESSPNGVIYGVAKGSGMIAPNMATMLGFITTDLDVTGLDLQAMLKRAADQSFNCMTVDGDTSTNDMLLVLANGASGVKVSAEEFEAMLTDVCVSLAKQIARDGEGATKLVEVIVRGSGDPVKVARTIGESPLVKTAMFGCDPNWGRILAAAGRSGVPFAPVDTKLVVRARDEEFLLFQAGEPTDFDPKRVSAALKSDHVVIDLTLGEGEVAKVYTCDFGYGYVRINAEYHT